MSQRGGWVALTAPREHTTRHGVHRFSGQFLHGRRSTRSCPWPFCVQCGLVLLKNRATSAAAGRPCSWTEDA